MTAIECEKAAGKPLLSLFSNPKRKFVVTNWTSLVNPSLPFPIDT
jgi:hypothetical protein